MNDLPAGWTWASLSQVCEINPKHVPDVVSPDDRVTFVPMAAIDETNGEIAKAEVRKFGEVRKGYTHFAEGDVLFAKITPCMENGKAAVARNLENGIGCGTTELHVLRPVAGILPEFIFHYLRQESFRREAAANMTGTAGQLRVPAKYIRDAKIPVCPLPEQSRIVSVIREVLTRNRITKSSLGLVPSTLHRLRQSVLAKAFRGKLTERKPGEKITEWFVERTVTGTGRKLIEGFLRLPESWMWATIEDACTTASGGTPLRSRKEYFGGKIPWLKSGELEDSTVTQTQETITELGLNESNTKMFPKGTVLIALYGATVGKTGILGIDSTTNQAVCAIFNDKRVLDTDYLFFYLRSRRDDLVKRSFGGAQPNISQEIVRKLGIPICPMGEQLRVVDKIRQLLAHMDDVERDAGMTLRRAGLLEQSILSKAFQGQLVPQNPHDAQATVLLETIQTQRAIGSKKGR